MRTHVQARALPVRRRPRCPRHRPRAASAPGGRGRAWSRLGLTDGGPDATVQPQPVQDEDGPERAESACPAGARGVVDPGGALPGGGRPAVPHLHLRLALPGQERRIGGGPVSTDARMRIESPADLQRAMKAAFPPSEEQWAAISAPLEPAVVIAGAGSGKTTLMAARVVYLVLTGQVRPEEVLGLTFTTKAAAEPAPADPDRPARRGRPRPRRDRRRRRGGAGADGRDLQRLRRRAAHRPRPADRARARHPGDHRRGPLPARRPGRGPLHRRHRAPHRPPRDGHPEPARPRLRDERAPGRARPGARPRRRGPPRLRAGARRGGWPARPARPTSR
ncbi:UvrD-helicase domain-containing protein [Nocardioides convexus]|uniref:UvrD-helicase domain-containing protein n=1 Tax=Nocardioides convexus TaxID=2712224 RepID=UPI00241866DA|nr:UvrD-helicase domain-containing protein [Nocardioides convexus]